MAGWELKEGKLNISKISQDDFWNILKVVFSNKSRKSTTYKYCFFKSIIDNVFNCDMNYTLSLDEVFVTVAEIYWNLVHIHGLKQYIATKQRNSSRIEIIIHQIVEKNKIPPSTHYEFLSKDIKNELNRKVKNELKTYVIGAFYGDTKGKLYSFSKKDKFISLHPNAYEYLVKHKYIVEKLNYYEWLRFLEKVNPQDNAYALANKLDEANKRVSLKKYREFLLYEYGQNKCFYCGKKLKQGHIHVDHFIPWSYMKSDQLWNFVLACNKCNSSKSDKLPEYKFLEDIIKRNEQIISIYQSDYVRSEFKSYNKEKLKLIFNAAMYNGLDTNWGA